ncbi:MAG: hypothetical protein ACJ749_05870 [Flavisolibacter sp.]
MDSNKPEEIFFLLKKINGSPVETFKNFPEIVRAGSLQLPKDDFDYLLAEGYLEVNKTDSFGKLLQLSERGKLMLKKDG